MTNKEFFIKCWEKESAVTVKGIRSLPNDLSKLNYKHHPKTRSPWELVNHIGPHAREITQAITEGRADLVNEGMFDINAPHIYKTPEAAAQDVEAGSQLLLEAAKKCDENEWFTKIIPVYWGPNKLFETPLMQFAWILLNDTIHHRGQLSTYYRLIGTAQPNIYGPTAEEEEAMMAAQN